MNPDQTKGKWDVIKGRVKLAWCAAAEDNGKKVEDSAVNLAGVILAKLDDKNAVHTKLRRG